MGWFVGVVGALMTGPLGASGRAGQRMTTDHSIYGLVHFPKYFLGTRSLPKIFSRHPSHQIFGSMHGALNVDKKNN
jgi:hypothetical protein